jgi:IS1 family transposase
LISTTKFWALWFFAVWVILIAIVVGGASGKDVIGARIPLATDVSPVLMSAPVPVSDSSVYVQPTSWLFESSDDVSGQRLNESCSRRFHDLSWHRQRWRWGGSYPVGWVYRERPTQWIHLVFRQHMKSNASTPVLIDQTIGDGTVYSNFGRNVYVVESHPWTFFRFKGTSRNIGLSLSFLRQFIGSFCLFSGFSDEIIGFREGLGHFQRLSLCLVGLDFSSVCLLSSGNSQIVGIASARVHFVPLSAYEKSREERHEDGNLSPPQRRLLKAAHLLLDICELLCGSWLGCFGVVRLGYIGWRRSGIGVLAIASGGALVIHGGLRLLYSDKIVTQKHLTQFYLCNTVMDMANILNTDKQIAVIGALAEGSSIRSIERITGVHRDTIMRLGVKVGRGCATLLDAKMRDLPCRRLEFDEIWGFIGKKQRHIRPEDAPEYGDVWTFCAIDADTKLVPSFKVGKRDLPTAKAFVSDVAGRMTNRVQISADALRAYVDAIEQVYGTEVDFAQIVKTYEHDESQHPARKYSAPEFVSVEKRAVTGRPDMDLVSTSYIERLNATTRLHMRRLTRLTLAFSKKLENFEAAVALHFAYYNLVKRHGTLRCTPAMAAGVERDFWSVGDLVEAAS